MSTVEIVISGVSNRKESVCSNLPSAIAEKGNIIIRSRLEKSHTLNEHLVWLWGLLKHKRRYIKTIQEEGAEIICYCKVSKGRHNILPNGAEMIHLLNIELVLETK